jgi:hypothetical protein
MNNIKNHIPQSLNFKTILAGFKKILWFFVIVLITFNIGVFYLLD